MLNMMTAGKPCPFTYNLSASACHSMSIVPKFLLIGCFLKETDENEIA